MCINSPKKASTIIVKGMSLSGDGEEKAGDSHRPDISVSLTGASLCTFAGKGTVETPGWAEGRPENGGPPARFDCQFLTWGLLSAQTFAGTMTAMSESS